MKYSLRERAARIAYKLKVKLRLADPEADFKRAFGAPWGPPDPPVRTNYRAPFSPRDLELMYPNSTCITETAKLYPARRPSAKDKHSRKMP